MSNYPDITPSQYEVTPGDAELAAENGESDFSDPFQHVGVRTSGTDHTYSQNHGPAMLDHSGQDIQLPPTDEQIIEWDERRPDPLIVSEVAHETAVIYQVFPPAPGYGDPAAIRSDRDARTVIIANSGPGTVFLGVHRDLVTFPIPSAGSVRLERYSGALYFRADTGGTAVNVLRTFATRIR